MGVAIINTYLVLLFLLVHFKIVPWNGFWKASTFIVLVLLMFGLMKSMRERPMTAFKSPALAGLLLATGALTVLANADELNP